MIPRPRRRGRIGRIHRIFQPFIQLLFFAQHMVLRIGFAVVAYFLAAVGTDAILLVHRSLLIPLING